MPTTDPTCERTLLALPWLLNGSLEGEERRAVREHLIACPACRGELGRTRELLAAFQAGRQDAAAEPTAATASAGRVVAFRRLAIGRLPAHRLLRGSGLAWAAMIAVVLASGAGLWQASRSGERAARAEASAPSIVVPAESATAPRQEIDFESGSLAGLQVASLGSSPADSNDSASFDPVAVESDPPAPAPPVRASHPRRAAKRPGPQPAVISSMGFEGGDLGDWK